MVLAMRAESFEPHTASRIYALFGLRVRSDVPLPLAAEEGEYADIAICRMPIGAVAPAFDEAPHAVMTCEHGTPHVRRYSRPDGIWLCNPIATFHIWPDTARVDVFAEPEVDERQLALLLLGQVSVFLLRARHAAVLHASAVVTAHGAAVFLGQKGDGKSSLAAGFVQQGMRLLTDDVLAVDLRADGIVGLPSMAIMKLWQQTVAGVGGADRDLPYLCSGTEKRLLQLDESLAFATAPARLSAVYLLDRQGDDESAAGSIALTSMAGQQAVATLIAQTSWHELLAPAEVAASLPLYARLAAQLKFRLLRYPSGFQHQDAVRAAILNDLRSL
jgi:hypothetical protein